MYSFDTTSDGFNLAISDKDDDSDAKSVHTGWSIDKKSQLIKSFLLNMPVSQVFLYRVGYGNYKVIDGLNRILTIYDFYNNDFVLSGLEVLQKYNGARYKTLPIPVRRTLDRRTLTAESVLVDYSSDDYPTGDYVTKLLKIAQKRLKT